MKLRKHFSTLVLAAFAIPAFAQNDLTTVYKIKKEAFDRGQVMDHLAALTDRYGPRLTGSPEFDEAAQWATKQMREWGLENVHLETWGPFGRAYTVKHYAVEMVEPRYSLLNAMPLAWSASTGKPVTGDLVLAPFTTFAYNIAKANEDFEKYKAEWHGKLRGKIVLFSKPMHSASLGTAANSHRYTDAELADMSKAPEPGRKTIVKANELKMPDDPQEAREYLMSLPGDVMEELFDRVMESSEKRDKFFRDEGVVAMLMSDGRSHEGMAFSEAAGSPKAGQPLPVTKFRVTEEQYNRITRLLDKKEPVKIQVELEAVASERDVNGTNIVGEIVGTGPKKDEVVMIGAHFDSWHGGTGATDNAAGSAVMLEVMRILKTLNVKLDRTVRIGLWSGEEQGLFGSKAYVKEHYGDPEKGVFTPAHAKFDVYFNLDNGSGKIRGVYLQDNDAARPMFEKWLAPFRDLGVSTITNRNTGGTDHLSYDFVGLPGFQFIQDPLDYMTVTHHSSMDTYDHAVPADLMQASAVIAACVYQAANSADAMPRKAMPVAPGAKSTVSSGR